MYSSHWLTATYWTLNVHNVTRARKQEGRKEMFYLTTHSTHFIYGYMASDIIMVKDRSDSERGNSMPPHWLLFPISSKGYFISTIPQTW